MRDKRDCVRVQIKRGNVPKGFNDSRNFTIYGEELDINEMVLRIVKLFEALEKVGEGGIQVRHYK